MTCYSGYIRYLLERRVDERGRLGDVYLALLAGAQGEEMERRGQANAPCNHVNHVIMSTHE